MESQSHLEFFFVNLTIKNFSLVLQLLTNNCIVYVEGQRFSFQLLKLGICYLIYSFYLEWRVLHTFMLFSSGFPDWVSSILPAHFSYAASVDVFGFGS